MTVVCIISSCSLTNWFIWGDGNSGDEDTLPVAVFELAEMAGYCNTVYVDAKTVKGRELSYTIKYDRGVTIVIIRGTANVENAVADIDIRPLRDKKTGLWFHTGFAYASNAIFTDLKANFRLDQTVYVTGHSFGGAVAQIIGIWLDKEGHNVQIYTFGAPKVTNVFLGNRPAHYRVAMRSDPVPFMPPLPFLHWGIYIDPETLEWDESHEETSFLQIDVRDHSIREYFNILSEHIFPKLCDECK